MNFDEELYDESLDDFMKKFGLNYFYYNDFFQERTDWFSIKVKQKKTTQQDSRIKPSGFFEWCERLNKGKIEQKEQEQKKTRKKEKEEKEDSRLFGKRESFFETFFGDANSSKAEYSESKSIEEKVERIIAYLYKPNTTVFHIPESNESEIGKIYVYFQGKPRILDLYLPKSFVVHAVNYWQSLFDIRIVYVEFSGADLDISYGMSSSSEFDPNALYLIFCSKNG